MREIDTCLSESSRGAVKVIKQKIEKFLSVGRSTLLGVGPMSKNTVDVTIELANQFEIPLMLIASRRQIECAEFGGGYVNGWTTEEFAKYVIDRDKKAKVMLARDHGGPWQNPLEVKEELSLRRAMESAKKSYRADIESGFEIIHIDPSVDIHGTPSISELLDRVFELYEYCWSVACQNNRDITFEIGTEEQSGSTNTLEELNYVLTQVLQFCHKNHLPEPSFIVMQTGTRVMETRNVGSFDSPFRIKGELPAEIQVPKMLDVCRQYRIFMKEHNTDYLSDEALSWHPRLGIHAANVAPEFGVAETKALLALLEREGLAKYSELFIDLAYSSKKWEKWMLPGSTASKTEKAVICGHYVFSTPEFKAMKSDLQEELARKGIDIDTHLKSAIRESILRYLKNFRLLRSA